MDWRDYVPPPEPVPHLKVAPIGSVAVRGNLRAVKVAPHESYWTDLSGVRHGDSSNMWLIDGDEHPVWEHLMREEWEVVLP